MKNERKREGEMTVREAGHLGGERGGKKGGETTKRKYGHDFYEDIGHKGGEKVKRLVREGKESEEEK